MSDQQPDIVIVGSDGKTEHHFPAGMDPQKAAAIVRQSEGGAAPSYQGVGPDGVVRPMPTPSQPVLAKPPSNASLEDRVRYAAAQGDPKAKQLMDAVDQFSKGEQQFNKAAPLIGSVVASGGLAGIPAVLASAGGGAAGQLYTDAGDNMSLADRVKNAVISGVGQGAASGAGQLISKGMQAAGNALMTRALSPTERLGREFPNLSQTAINNALTVSNGGLQDARTALNAAKATANNALKSGDAAGVTIDVHGTVKDAFNRLLGGLSSSSDPMGDLAELAKLEKGMMAHPPTLTPTAADALKRGLQQEAKTAYTAAKMGNSTTLAGDAKMALASELNQKLQSSLAGQGINGYAEGNAAAQPLIGTVRAISRQLSPSAATSMGNIGAEAARRSASTAVGAALGGYEGGSKGAIAGAAAGAMAGSPANLSRVALALSHPVMRDILSTLPKPAVAAIIGMLTNTKKDDQ